MNTPWGDIEVADAHAHVFSRAFFESLSRQLGQQKTVDDIVSGLGWESPPADNAALGARWTAELDRHGVARSVLMSSIPDDEASAAAIVRANPDRFYGYFMFNPLSPGAVNRATYAFDELGLPGLCLFPAMHRYSIQDPLLEPIYALAETRQNVVIFVHSGVLTVGIRKKLGLTSRFDMSLSNPIDLHRVAMEHPRVNFVIPHFGAGYFRETLMLGDLAPNVYMDTSGTNSWIRYLLPEVTLKDVYQKSIEVYGTQRLLFGTDSSFFPRGWNRPVFEAQVEALHQLNISTEAAHSIFGGNLRRLLGEQSVRARD
jgi:hypothetical protein